MTQICDEIRNLEQCLEVREPTAWARRLGHIYPEGILFRVTPNIKANAKDQFGWWALTDLAFAVVHREHVLCNGQGWYVIPARYAPHLISAFDVVGATHRLQFMAVTG